MSVAIQNVLGDVRTVGINQIALERIALISVHQRGLAKYDAKTTTDFESFRELFPGAKFVFATGKWRLFESYADLVDATIEVKP